MTHNSKNEWHERFYLYRQADVTGYSGTGVVAEGIRFSDGTCALRWCVPDKPRSTVIYDSILDAAAIHGHNGSTLVMWMDEVDTPLHQIEDGQKVLEPA